MITVLNKQDRNRTKIHLTDIIYNLALSDWNADGMVQYVYVGYIHAY